MSDLEPRVDMPCIRYGGVAYPVLFSLAAIKRWAEYRDQTFAEALAGWDADSLSDQDIRTMLHLALEAGEHRRRLFSTAENQIVTEELLDAIFDTYHPMEVLHLLARIWNQIPGRAPDPQMTEAPPTGETCSA